MRTREDAVDGLLVLAARTGDTGAFERLVARWHPRLARHARRLTGDADGARDVVQDTWVAVVRGLPRLADPSRFGAWALRIATRRAADWVGGRGRTRARAASEHEAASLPDSSAGADSRLVRTRAAFRALEHVDRTVMSMYYVEGYSVAETAAILGIPPGTVKSRLYHARERLRAALEVSDGTPD